MGRKVLTCTASQTYAAFQGKKTSMCAVAWRSLVAARRGFRRGRALHDETVEICWNLVSPAEGLGFLIIGRR